MTAVRDHIVAALAAIEPLDELERVQRADAIAWARAGGPLCRTAKPATPPKHLVSYFAVVDLAAQRCLLVDHRLAGLWLPTGGHVEPDELPAATVARESVEELGVEARLVTGLSSNPLFVTQATTVGTDAGHVDVSLWYVCEIHAHTELRPDPRELVAVRWWPFAEIMAADAARLDPNLPRFIDKLTREGRKRVGQDARPRLV
jgi:8-oxo-dGTP pyrophosphatase MutT (NUDIX family)